MCARSEHPEASSRLVYLGLLQQSSMQYLAEGDDADSADVRVLAQPFTLDSAMAMHCP